jgi:hypothetical protein
LSLAGAVASPVAAGFPATGVVDAASGGFGFSLPARRSTGGPSSTFIPRGSDDSVFLGSFAAAANALADCQRPWPSHS